MCKWLRSRSFPLYKTRHISTLDTQPNALVTKSVDETHNYVADKHALSSPYQKSRMGISKHDLPCSTVDTLPNASNTQGGNETR